MKTTTEMQLVPVAKLVPYINNARTHSPEQISKLRSSLREFGFINPVIIDRDFGVIAGHGRILAAKEEGIEEVPCVFVDYLTEAQKKAYILADNRMALDAGWDEELLRIEIESLQGEDFDVGLTGFTDDELYKLFGEEKKAKDDDFDLSAALEKAAFVKPGDIWTVGRHRLVCGDATSADDVAKLMNGNGGYSRRQHTALIKKEQQRQQKNKAAVHPRFKLRSFKYGAAMHIICSIRD